LELWLDKLALAKPTESTAAPGATASEQRVTKQNVMTFAPDGTRGVAAYVDGQQAASV
jgi:hypothetical protein